MSKSMKDDEQELALEALYQRRKKRYASPKSLNQQIYANLATTTYKRPWWKLELKQYFQVSALAMSCAIAFIVVNSQLSQTDDIAAPNVSSALFAYKDVTYHVLDEPKLSASRENVDGVYARAQSAPSQQRLTNELTLHAESRAESDALIPDGMQEKELLDTLARKKSSREQLAQQRKVMYQRASSEYMIKQNNVNVHQQTYATVIQSDTGLDLLTCEQELVKISQEVLNLLFSPSQNQALALNEGALVSLSYDNKGHIINLVEEKIKKQC